MPVCDIRFFSAQGRRRAAARRINSTPVRGDFAFDFSRAASARAASSRYALALVLGGVLSNVYWIPKQSRTRIPRNLFLFFYFPSKSKRRRRRFCQSRRAAMTDTEITLPLFVFVYSSFLFLRIVQPEKLCTEADSNPDLGALGVLMALSEYISFRFILPSYFFSLYIHTSYSSLHLFFASSSF